MQELATNPLAGKVFVYSWDLDETRVKAALASGASGYLSKGIYAVRLVRALHYIRHSTTFTRVKAVKAHFSRTR